MSKPVNTDNAIVNPSTDNERLLAVFPSNGRKLDAILGTSGTRRHARNAPSAPAKRLTSKLSQTKSLTILLRDAPTAIRRAISRRRLLKRTSKRFATLLHAISNTKQTAAKSVAKPARMFSVTSWGSVLTDVPAVLSILFG